MPVPAFADIGKATKELLYGSRSDGIFQYDQKVTLSSKTATGVSFTVTAVKKGEALEPSVKAAYSSGNFTGDVTFTTSDKVLVNGSVSNVAPGLKLTGTILLPDVESGKLTVDYINPYLNAKASMSLTSAPKLDAAVSSAYKNWVVGGDFGYDTNKATISKWNVGAGLHAGDYQVGATLLDKGGAVKLALFHSFAQGKSWGADIVKKVNGSETAFGVGYSSKFANGALFKSKLDNNGLLSLLYETKLTTGEKVAVTAQLDATNLSKAPKTGLAFNLN